MLWFWFFPSKLASLVSSPTRQCLEMLVVYVLVRMFQKCVALEKKFEFCVFLKKFF